MLQKILIGGTFFLVAFSILFISILRSAAVRHDFPTGTDANAYHSEILDKNFHIDYELAFPGKTLADSSFWPLKAARDQIWLFTTVDKSRKADLYLLFADKRLGASVILFEKENYDDALSSLVKGERYLELASAQEKKNRDEGLDTKDFLLRLTNASLKHAITIEEISVVAPSVVVTEVKREVNISKKVYTDARNALRDMGIETPNNPFDW